MVVCHSQARASAASIRAAIADGSCLRTGLRELAQAIAVGDLASEALAEELLARLVTTARRARRRPAPSSWPDKAPDRD
jgi:hypothetical protein